MKRLISMVSLLVLSVLPAVGQAAVQATSRPAGQSPASSATSAGRSNIDPAKEADIRHLLDLAGTKALMVDLMTRMSEMIKPLMVQGLPPGDYRDKLVDLFFQKFQSKANVQQLLDLCVPIYDKYFSAEEVKSLIAFYETPAGKKMVSILPKLMADVSQLGEEWGGNLGREAMREVLAEHPDLAEALQTAEKTQQ